MEIVRQQLGNGDKGEFRARQLTARKMLTGELENDELDIEQRGAEVVEATLDGDGCGGHPGGSLRPLWAVVARR